MTVQPYRTLPDLTGGVCMEPDQDPANWHPEGPGARQQAAVALAGCARCEVRDACLADALEWEAQSGHSWGIWGNLDEYDRAKLLGRRTQGAVA